MFVLNICVVICWVRIDQRVGYELIERGYETSEPGYESSGYERSMGTKRLVSFQWIVSLKLRPWIRFSCSAARDDVMYTADRVTFSSCWDSLDSKRNKNHTFEPLEKKNNHQTVVGR